MTSTNVEPASTGEIIEDEVQAGAAVTSDYSETSTAQRTPAEEQGLHDCVDTLLRYTEYGKEIGRGGQAIIRETRCQGRPFVLKIYKYFSNGGANGESNVFEWDDKAFNVIAPHVCSSVGYTKVHDGKDSVALFMPRHLLDLRKLIDSKRGSSKQPGEPFLYVTAVDLIVQLAIGMRNLHKRDITHRDIRAANLLVTHITPNKKLYAVAIADFDGCKNVIGTGFWRAPEVLEALSRGDKPIHDITFTFACDVYSFAVTCYEILTGGLPFEGKAWSEYDGVLYGERPKLPGDLAEDMASLVNRCWHQDPLERPNSNEILELLREMIRKNPELKPVQTRFDLADPWSGEDISEQLSPEELLQSLKDELEVLEQQNEILAVRLGNEFIELYEKYKSAFGLVNIWSLHRLWDKLPVSLPMTNKGNEFIKSLPDHGSNTVKILKIFSQLIRPLVFVEGFGSISQAYVRYSDALLQFIRSNVNSPVKTVLRSISQRYKDWSKSFRASNLACRFRFARTTTMRALRRFYGVRSRQSSAQVEALVDYSLVTGSYKTS